MLKPKTPIGGKYFVKHILALGGMAEVYLGEDAASNLVVLKRLLPAFSKDKLFLEMFFKEALTLQQINHENIVKFYDFFCDKNDYFIVTEFIYGKDLSLAFNYSNNRNKEKIVTAVAMQLCQALAHIHSRGFIHQDISPKNVMIGVNGEVKLIDFGVVKALEEKNSNIATMLQGKINFISPEMMEGNNIDQRSDLFSLGLTLLSIIKKNGKLIDIKDRNLHKIIMQLIEKNPNKRYSNSPEVYKDLSSIFSINNINKSQRYLRKFIKNKGRFNVNNFSYVRYMMSLYLPLFFALSIVVGPFMAVHYILKHKKILPTKLAEFKEKPTGLNIEEEEYLKRQENISPINGYGFLLFEVAPWAYVYIDDELIGVTPLKKLSLLPGEYVVKFVNPELSAVTVRLVKIKSNQKTQVKITLRG